MIKVMDTLFSFEDMHNTSLRYMLYHRVWPAHSREFVIMTSCMSIQDLYDRSWISEEHFSSYAHPSKTYVTVNASADEFADILGVSGVIADLNRPYESQCLRAHLYMSCTVVEYLDETSSKMSLLVHTDPKGDMIPSVMNTMLGVSIPNIVLKMKLTSEGDIDDSTPVRHVATSF